MLDGSTFGVFFRLKMVFFMQFLTARGCSVCGRRSEPPNVFREENTENEQNTLWQRRRPQRTLRAGGRCRDCGRAMVA